MTIFHSIFVKDARSTSKIWSSMTKLVNFFIRCFIRKVTTIIKITIWHVLQYLVECWVALHISYIWRERENPIIQCTTSVSMLAESFLVVQYLYHLNNTHSTCICFERLFISRRISLETSVPLLQRSEAKDDFRKNISLSVGSELFKDL
jgi:hypothetical protein